MYYEEYGFKKVIKDDGTVMYSNLDLYTELSERELYEFIETARDCGYTYAIKEFNDAKLGL